MSKSGGNPTNAPVPNRNENFGISGCLNETISSNFHYEVVMGLDIFHSVLISMPSGPSKEQYTRKEEKGGLYSMILYFFTWSIPCLTFFSC